MDDQPPPTRGEFTSAEMGMLAHLYRGELYRSTVWRTRLDTTTNWAVVTLGIALSITFATPNASPLPLILVGILIVFFLMQEARRYRYFNVWRARCRWMELHMIVPLLESGDMKLSSGWQHVMAEDYRHPTYHVSLAVAVGRRIRRNYIWILLIQMIAYIGKLIVHPTPLAHAGQLFERAAIGPAPGWLVLLLGVLYCTSWAVIAFISHRNDRRRASRNVHQSGMA